MFSFLLIFSFYFNLFFLHHVFYLCHLYLFHPPLLYMLEENNQSALQPNCTFICMDEHHTHILYAVDNYITLCSNESIWKGLYELETHTIWKHRQNAWGHFNARDWRAAVMAFQYGQIQDLTMKGRWHWLKMCCSQRKAQSPTPCTPERKGRFSSLAPLCKTHNG